MIVKIDLTNILGEPTTTSTSGVSAGASVNTSVVNTANFAANDFAVVGNLGDESSEVQTISSITNATTIVFGGITVSHPAGTPIRKVLYDQVKLERSSDNVSFSVIATITIKGDQIIAEYNDTTGATTDYYRLRFYNSTTATYSGYSNSFALTSPSAADVIIDSVIKDLGTEYDEVVNKSVIFNALADTDLRIGRELVRTNKEFYKTSTSINLVAGTQEYALPNGLVQATRVLVAYNTGDTPRESIEIEKEFGDNTDSFADIYHYLYRKAADGLTYLGLKKIPANNVTSGLTVEYITKPLRIMKTTDTLLCPQPMMYVDVIKNGIKEIIYRDFKNDLSKSQYFGGLFADGLGDLRVITNNEDTSEGANIISRELGYVFSESW